MPKKQTAAVSAHPPVAGQEFFLAQLKSMAVTPDYTLKTNIGRDHTTANITDPDGNFTFGYFSPDKDGNLLIHYPNLLGRGHTFRREGNKYPESYARTRLKTPMTDAKTGTAIKYLSPKGSGVYPFFPKGTVECHLAGRKTPVLVLIEGEKKAVRAEMAGLCTVGLPGIHGFSEAGGKPLHADLEKLIASLQVETIVLLLDADTLTINYKAGHDLAKRPQAFHAAAAGFAEACRPLTLLPGATLKNVYLMHIRASYLSGAKGLDDLYNADPENTEQINADLARLSSARTWFSGINLLTATGGSLKKYFGLTTAQQFHKVYGADIGEHPFVFSGKRYRHQDGELVADETEKLETVRYNDSGIQIYGGRKGWTHVAEGFHLKIKYATEDEGGEKTWILEIMRIGSDESVYLEIPHETFCSARKLSNELTARRLTLKISDEELQELQHWLFSHTQFADAVKINRYGHHAQSGIFFFSDMAVNGRVLEPDSFGIVESGNRHYSMPETGRRATPFYRLGNVGTGGAEMDFNSWFRLYADAHRYEIALLPSCFYLMSLFRDITVENTKASPILYLKGPAGSGKSSVARNVSRLFGIQPQVNLKNKNTEAALVKLMSQSSNTVIWFDEFHNEFPYEGLLQAAYDNDGYHRSSDSKTNRTDSVDIYSALMLTSNYLPKNPVFFSRCIYLPVLSAEKTAEQKRHYDRLSEIETGGLGRVTAGLLPLRELVATQYAAAYDRIYASLRRRFGVEKVAERLLTNMARLLAPACILQTHGKIAMHEFADPADILDELCHAGYTNIVRQHRITSEKSNLSDFFEILQLMYESYQIHPDTHYRFEMRNGAEMIALRLPTLYMLFAAKFRSMRFDTPPDRDTIQSELAALGGKDNWEEMGQQIRFIREDEPGKTHGQHNSCWLEYDGLQQRFDVNFKSRRSRDQ